jgi:hypothetical protein
MLARDVSSRGRYQNVVILCQRRDGTEENGSERGKRNGHSSTTKGAQGYDDVDARIVLAPGQGQHDKVKGPGGAEEAARMDADGKWEMGKIEVAMGWS